MFSAILMTNIPATVLCGIVLCAGLGSAVAAQSNATPQPEPWMLGPFQKADKSNPILTPDPNAVFDCPMTKTKVAWEHDHVFNPGAVVRGGKVYLLIRSEDNSGEGIGNHTSRIGLAESRDGVHFTVHPAPVLYPDNDNQKANEWTGGCEDPRVVETPDGGYLVMYTQWNHAVARLASATSRDLVHWVKNGPVFARADGGKYLDTYCKSGAVVTERKGDHLIAARINGKYWMYFGEGQIYLASSTDLVNWDPVLDASGNWQPILQTRPGAFDSDLVEAGPPAVITKNGILLIYNGKNASGDKGDTSLQGGAYSGGQVLFDAHDLTKVLSRSSSWFITPERPYERTGQYAAGTVFVEGLVHFHKHWFLYYGTADTDIAVAVAND